MGIIKKLLDTKEIEKIYLEVGLQKIYFDELYTKSGDEILYIEKELMYTTLDVSIDGKVTEVSMLDNDDISSICDELKRMLNEFNS